MVYELAGYSLLLWSHRRRCVFYSWLVMLVVWGVCLHFNLSHGLCVNCGKVMGFFYFGYLHLGSYSAQLRPWGYSHFNLFIQSVSKSLSFFSMCLLLS